MAKATPKNSFESSLQRLEKIVETLEEGNTTLDDSLTLYEEGVEISQACMEKLSQAELKLKRITKKLDGSFELFDEKLNENE
ncbi:MAG: exodeoxyribonuclease VII small subunit [Ignavibacteriales bacterium]|nr:exodeoxyribonuclease VII small subunit [Ignavibacteriales bacterium]